MNGVANLDYRSGSTRNSAIEAPHSITLMPFLVHRDQQPSITGLPSSN